MDVLIVGAGGQVGGDLVAHAQRLGWRCHLADIDAPERVAAAPVLARAFAADPTLEARWHRLDVTDAHGVAALVSAVRPQIVFHLAALLSATGEQRPTLAWRVNVDGLRNVLEALAALGGVDGVAPMLIFPSSIAAYGPVSGLPELLDFAPNDAAMRPITMYGVTKVVGESLGSWYAQPSRGAQRVDFRGVRFPGLLNATPPGGGSSDYANEMYFAAAAGARGATAFVKPESRIPFMHMRDAVRALVELALAPEASVAGRRVYNISACAPTALEIAQSIERVTGRPFDVTWSWEGDPRLTYVESWPRSFDDAPAREDWDWRPELELDALTRALIEEIAQST
jgi:threonine 3-dehydrogenase